MLADYNDVEGPARLIGRTPTELAAVLVEPMQGAAAASRPSQDFLRDAARGDDRGTARC